MSDEIEKKDVLKPHQFDGIQEYDNQLPRWWLYGFYLSIIFALFYFVRYQIEDGPNLQEIYEREQQAAADLAKQQSAEKKPLVEEELLAIAKQPHVVSSGEKLFLTKCASCHANDGGGLVGPNLTDDYWIHGNKMTELLVVISKGVSEKGMPNWSALMSEDEIISAAAYVKSLQGKKPAAPKPPEGMLLK